MLYEGVGSDRLLLGKVSAPLSEQDIGQSVSCHRVFRGGIDHLLTVVPHETEIAACVGYYSGMLAEYLNPAASFLTLCVSNRMVQ
jgi:hypothetical protein